MKVTKKTIVTIELDEIELMKLETELNILNDHPTFKKSPKSIILTTDILTVILED